MDVNNQGLNIPSNLQNLDVRDELLSKEVGSGVNCAYSLRDLTGNNLNCVRVRREPEDTTNAIDDEKIFPAQAVASREVEDWVNGKLENTLPLDVATGSAGYSLRKIKSSYNDNAVRIRRISDSVEVDVAFDSDNKVSASSAITNTTEQGGESGETNATDLNGFLNEIFTVGVAVEGGASASDRPDSFTNATNSSFTATVTDTAGGYFPYKSAAGDAVTVSFDLVLSGGASPSINTSLGVNTVATRAAGTAYSSSGSYTFTLNCNASADHIRFADSDDGTFAVTNFRVTSHTHQAFVHTWYDQAGSNNAVQATADNQPKIAENGALLADGIDFDGSDDFLESTGLSSIYTGTDTVSSTFVVVNSDVATTTQYIIGAGNTGLSNPMYNTLFHSGGNLGWQARDTSGTLKSNLSATPYVADQMYLVSNINSGTTTDFNSNAVVIDDGADSDVGDKTINTVKLGARGNASSSPLNGSIKEAIFYATDQSDNRFKIESNINNYYGLYNDANDTSDTEWQFHNTETGTSANGTDGYVFKNSDADVGIASLELKEGVVSGDIIYYSFFYDRTTGSPTVRLASDETDSASSVSNNDAVGTVTGFISGTLTATGTGSFFMIADNDNPSDFTISNFRMSRIARNGFVETWYDQSGNDKHLSQVSASNQPKIILNGGQDITDGLHFDNDQTLGENAGGTPNQSSAFFTFVATLDASTTRPTLAGGNADIAFNSTPDVLFRANGTNTRTATNPAVNIIVGQQHLISIEVTSLTPIVYVDDGSHTLANLTANVAPTFKILGGDTGGNATYALDGRMSEAIAFDGDKSTDVSAIRAEQNNYYNIY